MSTRATISVTDQQGRFDIYQHHDGYEVLDLRTSFVRDIVRTVQREPF